MLATNLATALAYDLPTDVALVDLDCVFGDVASVLGMVPDRTIGQLAMLPSFDSTMLKVFLTRHDTSGPAMNRSSSRQESDLLGARSIPAAAYRGVHTTRAVENFPTSGQPLSCMPELVRSLAFVKKAAAHANAEQALGVMAAAELQALLLLERLTRLSRLTG